MFPSMNPKNMEAMMKKLGVKQVNIDALEVIIKLQDKELVIKNPQVSKINAMGQDTIQVIGEIEERSLEPEIAEDDIQTVIDQTNCTEEEALNALKENNGDIAKAILSLK